MTTTQTTEPRFQRISDHDGPVVEWANADRHLVTGEGLTQWFASGHNETYKDLSLRKHVDQAQGAQTLMLEIHLATYMRPGDNMPLRWESALKVGEGRYVRASGEAARFPTALAQCEAHVHESRQLGGLTWWREGDDRWISWMGAFNLSATKSGRQTEKPYWHFEVRGDAPTLEEAALLAALGRLNTNGDVGGQGT